jgi:hypothetical protein
LLRILMNFLLCKLNITFMYLNVYDSFTRKEVTVLSNQDGSQIFEEREYTIW